MWILNVDLRDTLLGSTLSVEGEVFLSFSVKDDILVEGEFSTYVPLRVGGEMSIRGDPLFGSSISVVSFGRFGSAFSI